LVAGEIYFAHSAGAKRAKNFVRAKVGAGDESHFNSLNRNM
jgi:hypothetical protein